MKKQIQLKSQMNRWILLTTSIILFQILYNQTFCQDSTRVPNTSENLFNSTIKIQGFFDTVIQGKKISKIISTGTGFFFQFYLSNDTVDVVVTAKHVIEKSNFGVLRFNSSSTKNTAQYGDVQQIQLTRFNDLWIHHPTEDLSILILYPLKYKILSINKKIPFTALFDERIIPTKNEKNSEIDAIEEVLMIGYPKGFSDTINNIPIIRKGITATPYFLNYLNKERFLLDIPIYQGSSGSPIIIYQKSGYTTKSGSFNVGENRLLFLGIAVESQNYKAMGEIISNNPSLRKKTITNLPFEIAIAIKSSVLYDFKPILEEMIKSGKYYNIYKSIVD